MANLKTRSKRLQVTTTQHSRTVKRAPYTTLSQPNKLKSASLPKAIRLSREEYQDLMSEMQQAAKLIRASFLK
jgi:hypothetical protein